MKPIYEFRLSAVFMLLVGPCILVFMFDFPIDLALIHAIYFLAICVGVFHECIIDSEGPCSLCYLFGKRPVLSWTTRLIHFAILSAGVVEMGFWKGKSFITALYGLVLGGLYLARCCYCLTLPEWNKTNDDDDEGEGDDKSKAGDDRRETEPMK